VRVSRETGAELGGVQVAKVYTRVSWLIEPKMSVCAREMNRTQKHVDSQFGQSELMNRRVILILQSQMPSTWTNRVIVRVIAVDGVMLDGEVLIVCVWSGWKDP
jgi:hypothetical protein